MARKRLVLAVAHGVSLALAMALTPAFARAEVAVGADVSAVVPLGEQQTHVGFMTGLHGTYFWTFRALKIGPEIGFNYGATNPVGDARKALGGGYGGIRATFELIPEITPYAYVHAGYGVADARNLPDPNAREKFTSGALLDFTVGLARRVVPRLLIGLEAGYATIEPGKCFCARWVHVGVAANVSF